MVWPGVPSQTIPDCIRYIIGVFCYNFKSQEHSCFILKHKPVSKLRYIPCSGIHTSHTCTLCRNKGIVMFTYSIYEY